MGNQCVFKRSEMKFLITLEQKNLIVDALKEELIPDAHGKSTVANLYFDTPDYLLIRRSIDKPVYKEKLRLRSYGVPKKDQAVFLELKKKYKSVVYKRRMDIPLNKVKEFVEGETVQIPENNQQIAKEIEYFWNYYKDLSPRVYLSYDREAYYSKDDPDFRITFDTNLLWRNYDLQLSKGIYGEPILPNNMVLMEIKTGKSIPLYMVKLLSDNQIYKTRFSKYGTVYENLLRSC